MYISTFSCEVDSLITASVIIWNSLEGLVFGYTLCAERFKLRNSRMYFFQFFKWSSPTGNVWFAIQCMMMLAICHPCCTLLAQTHNLHDVVEPRPKRLWHSHGKHKHISKVNIAPFILLATWREGKQSKSRGNTSQHI